MDAGADAAADAHSDGSSGDGGGPDAAPADTGMLADGGDGDADAGGAADAGPYDLAVVDAGNDDVGVGDTGTDDAGAAPTPGFGTISGPCGRVDTELDAATPAFILNHLDFMGDGFDSPADVPLLTGGGQTIFASSDSVGSPVDDEIFSYEVLDRCEGATLLKSETEIVYADPGGKKTSMLVTIGGQRVGVAVTRAFGFPFGTPYTDLQAVNLLTAKLTDILLSSANVSPVDAWQKQLLVVLAYDDATAVTLQSAWNGIDAAVRANTVVYVVVTQGDDAFIYD